MADRVIKYGIPTLLIILSVVLFAFYGVSKKENPMIGTWTRKSGVYLGPDGTTDITTNLHEMKVINETHFTTLWQNSVTDKNEGFNGGRYTYKDGIYIEYLDYFSIKSLLGDTSYFQVEVDDNTISISSCDKNGKIKETGYFQVWERVEMTAILP